MMPSCHSTTKISQLMEELDKLGLEEKSFGSDTFWEPVTPQGKQVMSELVAPENRGALKDWYLRFRGITLNPVAEQLRRTLEKKTGESFH